LYRDRLLGESLGGALASEPVLPLSERICVALSGSIPWLDSAEGSVWVVRGLESSLSGLRAVRRADVRLLVGELLSISAHNDARIYPKIVSESESIKDVDGKRTEGEQEEDEETKDQPPVSGSEDALATILDLIGSLNSLSGIVDGKVYSLVDSCDGTV